MTSCFIWLITTKNISPKLAKVLAKVLSKLCQIINKPSKLVSIFAKMAIFCQIWSYLIFKLTWALEFILQAWLLAWLLIRFLGQFRAGTRIEVARFFVADFRMLVFPSQAINLPVTLKSLQDASP